jgi:DNA-binding transcriptional LysR family regulator
MAYQSGRALAELAAFVVVVESSGFSAAARASGERKATLSSRVSDLEARLGVPLLVRTTRSLRLTEEGRAYLEHAQRSITAARDADAVVSSARAKPHGLLRVTAPTSLADMLFDNVVVPYLIKNSEVSVNIDTSVRRIDLARERFDLAVRIGPLDDSGLVARRLGKTRGGYYASPGYFERRARPKRPEDLREHDTIAIATQEGPTEWMFVVDGKRRAVVVRPRLVVNSFDLAIRAASAAVGIVRAPHHFAAPLLAKKQLVSVLSECSPPGADVHAVMPPGGALVPKTRVFLDMLVTWFEKQK